MIEATTRSEHLLILAKCPREGHVKTRLTPPLSPKQATSLYRAFLADLFARAAQISSERSVEISTDLPWPATESLAVPHRAQLTLQGTGDLGARISYRVRQAFLAGAERIVLLGGDAPDLPKGSIEELFNSLDRSDATVVPASDGGYVALALAGPHLALFKNIPWGGSRVLETTLRRAEQSQIQISTLPPWHDVDTSDDLARLKERLNVTPEAAPRTSAWLQSELWTPV